MNQSFTDYLKNEFINGSMVKKDNFEELWEVWKEELDDDELNKLANEWKAEEVKKFIELADEEAVEVETETVGEATYTWIETTWDKDDIYTQVDLLNDAGGIGFTEGYKKVTNGF
jgi:hypothetical protein